MTEWQKRVITLGLVHVFRFFRDIFGKKEMRRNEQGVSKNGASEPSAFYV